MVRLIPTAGCLKRSFAAGVAFAAAAGLASAAHAGVATITSQQITFSADGPGPQQDEFTSTALTPLDETTVTSTDEGDGFRNQAFVTVQTENETGPGVDPGQRLRYFASYVFRFNDARPNSDPENPLPLIHPQGTVSLGTTFTVSEATNFSVDFFHNASDEPDGVDILSEGEARVFLGNDPSESLLTFTGETRQGVLQPGEYRFTFDTRVEGFAQAPVDGEYVESFDFKLDLSPVGGGGGEPTPIPLPPAIWSGLIVLGAGALNRLRRGRVA